MPPPWLHPLSIASLALAVACALFIAIDLPRRPQRMAIMDVVWPVTALFGSVLWLAGYVRWGRAPPRRAPGAPGAGQPPEVPHAVQVAKAASHCGSGCALGDLCAEWLAFQVPAVLVAFGWPAMFAERTWATWILDFLFAYAFGIVFQYFTIAPMRHLGFGAGLWAAIKADTLSLAAWQVGMYAFMGAMKFAVFRDRLGTRLAPDMPEFWFVMQGAMLCGFVTAYPVNAWLLKAGWKEAM